VLFFVFAFTDYAQAKDNECDLVAKRICTDSKVRESINWKDWHALALDSILGKNAAEMIRDSNNQLSNFQKDVIRGACVDSSKSLDMFLYYGVIK